MLDLDLAGRRLADAVMKGERIAVVGDYDADGVTSAALISLFLRGCKVEPRVRISSRGSGYGLGREDVDEFVRQECRLLVTLDLGTQDHDAVAYASEQGMEVMVIDHHRLGKSRPPALAFVNPLQPECKFPDKGLTAVGLSFYLAAAARRSLVSSGFFQGEGPDLKDLLDLVALGTVADVGDLRGVNRILVSSGLRLMERRMRTGLRLLWESSGRAGQGVTSTGISFRLAPRLNVAGRLDDAILAYRLLVSEEEDEVAELAVKIERLTALRKEIEASVLSQAIEQSPESGRGRLVLASGQGWHRGVIGIVAARLCEQTGLPSFVVSVDEDGTGVGSARGAGRMDVYRALERCSDLLVRFGGHREAAGFTVASSRLEDLRLRLEDEAGLDGPPRENVLEIDATLAPNQVNTRLGRDLQRLSPFGAGNPEPTFLLAGLRVRSARVVGEKHLRLLFNTPGGSIGAFAPRLGAAAGLGSGDVVTVAASIVVNTGSASDEIELLIRDFRSGLI